jgi:hypothetical protein
MSEQTQTTEGTPATQEAPAQAPAAEPEKPAGYVPRTAIAAQVNPLNEKIAAQDAELEKFRAEAAEREKAKLTAAQDIEGLKTTHEAELQKLRDQITQKDKDGKKSDLRMRLVAAGLDPDDAKDKRTINGIMAEYDTDKDAGEWFDTFKAENAEIFEAKPTTRTASATGSASAAGKPTDMDKLIAGYKNSEDWAVEKVVEMNNENKLTPELVDALGINDTISWGR